jgi:expansin
VPRVAEPARPSRHRAVGRHRSTAAVAAGLTAAVVVGAVILVGVLRVGTGPTPVTESLDGTAGPTAGATAATPTGSPAPRREAAPVAAGTLRAAPTTTTRSRSPSPSPTAASRERRPAPAAAGAARSGRATFYTLAGLPNCGYPDAAAPKGTVRVTVADQCPECEAGHLDLAAPAFARIADPVAGIVPVTFSRVVDPPTAGRVRIRVKEGSSPYWLALLPIDTGNPLASVTVQGRALERTGYGYWVAAAGAGPGPYRVSLTDDRRHTATVTVPLRAGATVSTGARLY